MSLNVWTQSSGYSFGVFPELVHLEIALPVNGDSGVTYSLISGSIPHGVYLIGNKLIGSPEVVKGQVFYKFCIRASRNGQFSDRTFNFTVNNVAQPAFITPPNKLAAGLHKQFYVLDGSYVSYQIQAVDLNPEIGQTLTYSILSGDGDLPPGITLSKTGLLSGFVGPVLISPSGQSHPFTTTYAFTVTVTDGINFSNRTFEIFVADPNAFRADSLMLDGLAGTFTSDSSFLQQPVWKTPVKLGIYRANNYITIPIELYDTTNITYRLEATNMEEYAVSFQVANDDNMQYSSTMTVTNVSKMPVAGQYFSFKDYVTGATSTLYKINTVASLGGGIYRLTLNTPLTMDIDNGVPFYIGSKSTLPSGMDFDTDSGEVFGLVPYQPEITQSFTFTITAIRSYVSTSENVTSSRTFNITLLGDITSKVTWISNSNLGSLAANYVSNLSVSATSNLNNATVNYSIVSGLLPPGLTLSSDGSIIGTVNQYYDGSTGKLGLLTYDGNSTTFDNGYTTFDHTYTFEVQASDQYQYSAASKTFTITITTPNTIQYSNIRTQPFLDASQRAYWREFINNTTVFVPDKIYRSNDVNFGVQSSLSMIVYAGIATRSAASYINSMSNGFKKKRFYFNSIQTAIAVDPNSGETLYEVIYARLVDPMEPNGKHLPEQILGTYYIDSITNWQSHLSAGVQTERNYLPLWMRTIQPGTKEQLGFILAVPFCYCKPGTAADIIANIKANGFNFKNIDYTVDRFIVDAVTGEAGDKYLAFNNNGTTI